ncbi:MFS transporter [Qingshengfaniella alkalisoli]|uniref:MFS transporter n=1 Tax=Qingshengfaniella alkalisoli TaxID=2599296 RepID=A0A5B8IXA5_9RHOB|nr:MFS transporter [Qingshengfaniella alkalisoli]QDY70792.1 MFS transporter [Qingshengfaniella alkalisoli]
MPVSASSGQLSPFKYPAFATIWSASLVSNMGTQLQMVGAGWLMTSLTASHDMVALVQSAATLPVMLFALLAGALADNMERRRIMIAAQSFMLLSALCLAAMTWAGGITPWLLLGLTFLIGSGNALNNPSWQASVGDLVPRKEVPQAVLLNSIGFNMTRSVGPALGGIIVAAGGAAAAFALNACSFVVMLGALARWKPPARDTRLPRENIWRAIWDGVSYVSMSPNILRVILRGTVFGIGAVCALALLPVITRDMLDLGATSYGLFLGCFGLGAIGGGFSGGWLKARVSPETRARGGFVCLAIALCWLALSRSPWLSAPAFALAGASWVLNLSLFNATVQLSAPRWVVGRAISLYQSGVFGGMALGSWMWGEVAETISIPVALATAAVLLTAGALIGLLLRLPEAEELDLDPLNRFREPQLELDLRARSGPIAVMIDYEIRQEDVEEFLLIMAHRRRIRLRDGARRWTLLRDLENPRLWSESYHVATWTEYVRHNLRRTMADADSIDRLRELHQGDDLPHVHRMIERPTVPRHDDMPLRNTAGLSH